jgi:sulfide:quinone oxidoreductase
VKHLLILGAGTSGTMMSNHLRKSLSSKEWNISIIDQEETHYYQPGILLLPFDIYKPSQLKKSIDTFIPKGVTYIQD